MSSSRDDFGIAFRSALLQRGGAQKFSLFFLFFLASIIFFLDVFGFGFRQACCVHYFCCWIFSYVFLSLCHRLCLSCPSEFVSVCLSLLQTVFFLFVVVCLCRYAGFTSFSTFFPSLYFFLCFFLYVCMFVFASGCLSVFVPRRCFFSFFLFACLSVFSCIISLSRIAWEHQMESHVWRFCKRL